MTGQNYSFHLHYQNSIISRARETTIKEYEQEQKILQNTKFEFDILRGAPMRNATDMTEISADSQYDCKIGRYLLYQQTAETAIAAKKTYLERCLNVIHGVNRQPNHLVSEFPILYRKWGSTAYSTAYILSIPNTDKKNNDFFHKIYCNDYRLQNNDNTHTENASKTSSVHEDVIQSSHYKSNNYFS